jgi:ATP-dependent RNA helicase DeaD
VKKPAARAGAGESDGERPKPRYGGPPPAAVFKREEEAAKAVKPAPAWAKPAHAKVKAPAAGPASKFAAPSKAVPAGYVVDQPAVHAVPVEGEGASKRKSKYEPAPRTGREQGMETIFLNVGRKQLVTPGDIVGKIAGVTQLPANVVGAIDIHQRHVLVDVAKEHVDLILTKLAGIPMKGENLAPSRAKDAPPQV